jgi:hypothetical protein
MLVTSRLVSPKLSAMSQTGTSMPIKLPEWITGRSFVPWAMPKGRVSNHQGDEPGPASTLRRHMVEVIGIQVDLASEELGKAALDPGVRLFLRAIKRKGGSNPH